MSTGQEEIIRGLVGLNKSCKRAKCNDVSLHPCLMDVQNIIEINGVDINVGAKAKFICNLLSLSEAAGEEVLVFGQYLRSLLFLEMLVTREKGWTPGLHTLNIDGGSTLDKIVERFNHSPDAKVLFGSIKSYGGEGVSLVGASRIVILEVHEYPSVTRQQFNVHSDQGSPKWCTATASSQLTHGRRRITARPSGKSGCRSCGSNGTSYPTLMILS